MKSIDCFMWACGSKEEGLFYNNNYYYYYVSFDCVLGKTYTREREREGEGRRKGKLRARVGKSDSN